MYNGLLQIHATHKLWYQMWGQSGCTLRRRVNVPQNCLKVPQVCLKVPQKFLKVPPLFSGTYFIARSNISQLQALATGIGLCGIQILILLRSTLLLKNVRLRIFEKSHLLLKYTPLNAVSICVVKMFYFEN